MLKNAHWTNFLNDMLCYISCIFILVGVPIIKRRNICSKVAHPLDDHMCGICLFIKQVSDIYDFYNTFSFDKHDVPN